MIKNLVVPQDHFFFDLLQKQAETAHAASHELFGLMGDYRDISAKVKKIKNLEHEGDELMRAIYTALNKTFIVPIDHADISSLANALDDVVDMVDHASALLVSYDIQKPSPPMVELSQILVEQTEELKNAVVAINHSRTYGKVSAHCNRVKHFEIKADEVHAKAITALFKTTDAIAILKNKEILDCLEAATDKADKASQNISDIVMKHA
jgi:predicted phosphate transport protein (TIGR00153 family)